jgi:DNA helicase-2/ATP-dependent DNA helicase PcrA
MEEGLFPHSRSVDDEEDIEEERRICYVCITRARERLILTSAARRRTFGEYQPTQPSRFLDEIPPELMLRVEAGPAAPRWQPASRESRNPYANRHGTRSRAQDKDAAFAYEQEDQSAAGVRIGMRVKHRQFGIGTVVSVEDEGDDYKVTVKFFTVGTKKLLARFAGLEPA